MAYGRFFFLADEEGQQWPVWTEDVTIGSAPSNTLVVPEPSVAGVQTRVWRALDRCWVRDEGALYGTLVNGLPVQGDQELHPGDTIAVGTREFRIIFGAFDLDHVAPSQPVAAKETGERPWKMPPAAILAPFALLIIVLGAALLAGRGQHDIVALDLERTVSDSEGVAHFGGDSATPLEIEVWNEYAQPWPDVEVARLAGANGANQAFFTYQEGLLSGAAFFPGAPTDVVHAVPNVMYQATPDQVRALAHFLRELGYGPDAYVDTVSAQVYDTPEEPAGAAVRLSVYGDGQMFYGVQRAGLVGYLQYEGHDPTREDLWDRYVLRFRDGSGGEPSTVVLYAASQVPIMSGVERLDAGEGGKVRVSFLAIDPWTYPGHPDPVDALEDHTLALGPTPDSDLEYCYRLLDGSGAPVMDWTTVREKAVCSRDGCQPTQVELGRLTAGSYTLEVYALDELENRSNSLQLQLAVTE